MIGLSTYSENAVHLNICNIISLSPIRQMIDLARYLAADPILVVVFDCDLRYSNLT